MSDEKKINALANIDLGKLPERVYDDAGSPAAQKLGSALGTVIDLTNTILWPIKWANERTRIYFEANLKKYQQKLEQIPEDRLIPVPPEIAKPILDRFSYVSNE